MPRILFSASFPEESVLRQTPGGTGRWGDYEYVLDSQGSPVDGWVVYDNLRQPMNQLCPPQNTLLITGEPESLRRYRSRFTSQFGQVWTSHATIQHDRLLLRNECQPWHYALRDGGAHGSPLGFDDLVELPRPEKKKLISVICSSKASSPDHRKRLEFVRFLQARLGDVLDVFGRGIREIDDKSAAIYDYKYHIVLENDHSQYFMTEKLADAFLGWSYPIYFGGAEAYHRFPEGSFSAIDVYKPEESLCVIRNVISAETYENNLERVGQARHRVLFENNLMAVLSEYWDTQLQQQPAQSTTLLPKNKRAGLVMKQFARSVRRPFSRRVA